MFAIPTTQICSACGSELPPAAKFCPECAHPVAASVPPPATRSAKDTVERILTATAALEGERKLVTVLFADLKGSMELIADRDPEEARRLLDPVLEHMCEAVEKYGGTVSQVMGDGVMAIFGAPISWEDHAVRACHAALSMQDLVRLYGDDIQRSCGVPIQIRVGLNSGEVVLSVSGHGLHMSYTAIGQTVHIAARMEQMAKPGSILATAESIHLAEGYVEARWLGPVSVKGIERPIEVAEIGRAAARRSRFETAPMRAMTPFMGRDAELSQLVALFDRVSADGTGRLAVITGEAGIGKSRLVHEFLRAVSRRNMLALDGGAAPYSSGAGYRPGVHILRQYFDLVDNEDVKVIQQKVAGKLVELDGDTNTVGVPILALLRALPANHRFARQPVNERRQRVYNALMWLAQRMTADKPVVLAYEDLQWVTSDTRDFLVAYVKQITRSTLCLLTYRPDYDASWLGDIERIELPLDGLAPVATRKIITDLLGSDSSLGPLMEELPRRSGGNPLFIEEYVRSMVDSGDLKGTPGRYQMGARRGEAAIPPTVRGVLAARIDRLSRIDKRVLQTFAVIGEVAGVGLLEHVCNMSSDEMRKSLRRLEMAGLLVERIDNQQLAYEFKHSLTQAVAYDTLLHKSRQDLHRRIMVALADSHEFDVLARHAVLSEAWEQALTYLRNAGRLAANQLASIESVAYFERALDVLKHLPSTRAAQELSFDIHCDLRNAMVPLGPQPRLLEVLLQAKRLAEQLEDENRLAQILTFLSNYYGNVGYSDRALETGERALVLGERVGAVSLQITGNMSVGETYRTLGNYPKAREFLSRAIELIEPNAEYDQLGQVGLPSVRARSHLSWTLAELGDFQAAVNVAAEAVHLATESGHAYTMGHSCLALGGTRLRQGEFESAIPILVRGLSLSEQVPLLRPPLAADLGVAHARSGRIEEGLHHVDAAVEGATTMGRMSRLPLMLAKCGEVHLLAGEPNEATRLATEALRLALEQQERGNEVYARLLLGAIHSRLASDQAEAARYYRDALALAIEIGMRPLSAHCHAGLWRLYSRIDSDDQRAREHRVAAATLYREMDMRFWLVQMDAEAASAASVA